jgi:NNP family nitrate/nitrite transporter-like MFS transporter
MGGLGGFFPPMALGLIRQQTGSFFWGFGLLTLFALLCLAVAKVISRQQVKLHALKTT